MNFYCRQGAFWWILSFHLLTVVFLLSLAICGRCHVLATLESKVVVVNDDPFVLKIGYHLFHVPIQNYRLKERNPIATVGCDMVRIIIFAYERARLYVFSRIWLYIVMGEATSLWTLFGTGKIEMLGAGQWLQPPTLVRFYLKDLPPLFCCRLHIFSFCIFEGVNLEQNRDVLGADKAVRSTKWED